MIIDNIKLPEDIERGVEGGPMFNTVVLKTDGGNVNTNQEWVYPLYRGNVAYGIQNKSDLQAVINFFWSRRGRLRGFLFKDWADFEMTDSPIATADGVEDQFQIYKHYSDTVLPFNRPITRPIESTIVVKDNGDIVSSSLWDLLPGGIIDFITPPLDTHIITITCEFDIPARFDTDQLKPRMEIFNVGSVPDLPIEEVRE